MFPHPEPEPLVEHPPELPDVGPPQDPVEPPPEQVVPFPPDVEITKEFDATLPALPTLTMMVFVSFELESEKAAVTIPLESVVELSKLNDPFPTLPSTLLTITALIGRLAAGEPVVLSHT